jgi:hypothetical protein
MYSSQLKIVSLTIGQVLEDVKKYLDQQIAVSEIIG